MEQKSGWEDIEDDMEAVASGMVGASGEEGDLAFEIGIDVFALILDAAVDDDEENSDKAAVDKLGDDCIVRCDSGEDFKCAEFNDGDLDTEAEI